MFESFINQNEREVLRNLIVVGTFLRRKKIRKQELIELEAEIKSLNQNWFKLFGESGFTWCFHQVINNFIVNYLYIN